jgi:hypothetical protein
MYSPGVRAVWHTLGGRRPGGMTQKGHFRPSLAKSTRPRSDGAGPTSENPLKTKLAEFCPRRSSQNFPSTHSGEQGNGRPISGWRDAALPRTPVRTVYVPATVVHPSDLEHARCLRILGCEDDSRSLPRVPARSTCRGRAHLRDSETMRTPRFRRRFSARGAAPS